MFVRLIGLLILGFFVVILSNSSGIRSERQNLGMKVKHTPSPPHKVVVATTETTTTISRRTYVPRGRLHVFAENETIATRRQAVMEEWGSWTLVDDNKDRPLNDYYGNYPHRDVPRTEFPSNAWQLDSDYLSRFLPESIQLVQRAQRAILAEYGQNHSSDMFHIFRYESPEFVNETGSRQGGWTTNASWQGLVKRILHAIITEDSFVFAMGGHSAAAGHGYVCGSHKGLYHKVVVSSCPCGCYKRFLLTHLDSLVVDYRHRNHFQQSYTLQIQWILESVFARMGVQLVARNFGNGGLGTVHNGMAAGDIYGHDVDMLMWDSSMTENNNRPQELFHRQGLLGSKHKVPVLWTKSERIARELNLAAGVEIGIPGNGNKGLQTSSTLPQLMEQTLAARYLKCSGDTKNICKNHQYGGVCWIDRPDVIPRREQNKVPGGRASWHPGKWEHQLFGRVLAFTILEATKDALTIWNDAENKFVLEDDVWHLSAHYERQRKRVDAIPLEEYHCTNYVENNMEFMCKYPLKVRMCDSVLLRNQGINHRKTQYSFVFQIIRHEQNSHHVLILLQQVSVR